MSIIRVTNEVRGMSLMEPQFLLSAVHGACGVLIERGFEVEHLTHSLGLSYTLHAGVKGRVQIDGDVISTIVQVSWALRPVRDSVVRVVRGHIVVAVLEALMEALQKDAPAYRRVLAEAYGANPTIH